MAKNKYGGVNDMEIGWTAKAENKRIYRLWFDMLRRCYDESQHKRRRGKTYENCIVCDRWFYLSNFYNDIQLLPGYFEWIFSENMSIDKDMLSKGKKEYSLETCCFVTISVNVSEMNKRNPNITKNANEACKTKYVLSKENEKVQFNSEAEACTYLSVKPCTVASCYRSKCKCKGYEIKRADMRTEAQHE